MLFPYSLNYKCVSARKELGGGVLLELSHELDLARWFFGDLDLKASLIQQSGLLDIDVEDQAILVCMAPQGFPISIRLNFCTKPPQRFLKVRGNFGEIHWDFRYFRLFTTFLND